MFSWLVSFFSLDAPPLSVVLVAHPHLDSGLGQDPLVAVLGGVEHGCDSNHSVIMKNHSDCEGSRLVKIQAGFEEPLVKLPTTVHLSSPNSCMWRFTNNMRGCIIPHFESIASCFLGADWLARATSIQSGLLWPEVGYTCVEKIWKKRFLVSDIHLCLSLIFSALSSPSTSAHLRTFCHSHLLL